MITHTHFQKLPLLMTRRLCGFSSTDWYQCYDQWDQSSRWSRIPGNLAQFFRVSEAQAVSPRTKVNWRKKVSYTYNRGIQ